MSKENPAEMSGKTSNNDDTSSETTEDLYAYRDLRSNSIDSIASDASTVIEAYQDPSFVKEGAQKKHLNDRKILSIYERWHRYEKETAEKEKLSKEVSTRNVELEKKQKSKDTLGSEIKKFELQKALAEDLISKEKIKFDQKGFFGKLASVISDFFVRNILRRDTYLDRQEALYSEYIKNIENNSSTLSDTTINIKNIEQEIAIFNNDIKKIEMEMLELNFSQIREKIEALEADSKLSSKLLTGKLLLFKEDKENLIKEIDQDTKKNKDLPAIKLIKVTLKSFLESPTEATLASLTQAMQANSEAYLKNASCFKLLKSAANLYPEIEVRPIQESKVTTQARHDTFSSVRGKIKENESKIQILEQEVHSLTVIQEQINEESNNLYELKRELAELDKNKSEIPAAEYEDDREEYLEGIDDNEKRLTKLFAKLKGVVKDSDGLDARIQGLVDKIENLKEVNQVLSSNISAEINAKIDSIIDRCAAKKRGVGASFISIIIGTPPEDMVKSALKNFVLAPSVETLERLKSTQDTYPVTDQAENTKLEQLINEALTLYKADRHGYGDALAARGSVEKSTVNASAIKSQIHGLRNPSQEFVTPSELKKGI